MQLDHKIKTIKEAINLIKKDYGNQRCKELSWGCPSCMGFILLDLLNDYLSLLKWEKNEKV